MIIPKEQHSEWLILFLQQQQYLQEWYMFNYDNLKDMTVYSTE